MKIHYKKENVSSLYPRRHAFLPLQPPLNTKIALPTLDGCCFEKIEDIIYLAADSNYTKIYFRDQQQILVCKTLKEIEASINQQAQFIRIHRSYTINLNFLQKYIKGKNGQVVLSNEVVLNISAGQKPYFMAAIREYFNF